MGTYITVLLFPSDNTVQLLKLLFLVDNPFHCGLYHDFVFHAIQSCRIIRITFDLQHGACRHLRKQISSNLTVIPWMYVKPKTAISQITKNLLRQQHWLKLLTRAYAH